MYLHLFKQMYTSPQDCFHYFTIQYHVLFRYHIKDEEYLMPKQNFHFNILTTELFYCGEKEYQIKSIGTIFIAMKNF